MQKGSGLLWALERRGAMQVARILLLAGLDAPAHAMSAPAVAPSRTSGRRRAPGLRRLHAARTASPLRLALP